MNRNAGTEQPENSVQKRIFSFRAKMLVYFGLLCVATLVATKSVHLYGIPFTAFEGEYKLRQSEIFKDLNLVADLKKERLSRWMEERKGDARVICKNPIMKAYATQMRRMIGESISRHGEGDERWTRVQKEEAYQTVMEFLNLTQQSYGVYEMIRIADAQTGLIIASTGSTELGANISQHDFFAQTLNSTCEFIGMQKDALDGKLNLLISCTIDALVSPDDNIADVAAVLFMYIKPDDFIKPILHIGEGLGKTGEALLVNQESRILTSLKHPLPDGTTAVPLAYQIEAKPATFAAKGEEGIIATEDYRGEPVFAAFRHIRIAPELGWGMVVKRDQSEVFAPIKQNMIHSFLIGSIGTFVILGVTYVIASRLSAPIRHLNQIAQQVEAGDLTVRAAVTSSDETSILAATFNAMIQRIQNWHQQLEDRVTARTNELNKTNQALRTEISEHKRTEAILREQKDKAQKYLDIVEVMLVAIDVSGKVSLINRKGCEILGYAENELIGTNWFEHCIPQRIRKGVKTTFERLMAGEIEPVEYFENEVMTKSGEKKIIAWHNTVLKTETDRIIGTLSSGEDITQRRQAEAEREDLIGELEAKNAELERFTYTVSHDLKSPLITIKGFLGLLEQDAATGDTVRMKEDIIRIAKAADKMERLLKELLELSRIGRLMNPPEEMSFGELAHEAVEMLSVQRRPRGVEVTIAPDLPMVYGDGQRLLELLENLIGNAIKFTGNQPHPRVEIGARREGEETVFYVRDNGVGIAPQYHQKIFGLFDKLDSQTEGTGVGLAIVHRIVEVHGGRIWVESEGIGQGSTFCFTLPNKCELTHSTT